jgi:hypothetical protein
MHVDEGFIMRTYGYGWQPSAPVPSTQQPAMGELVSLLAELPVFMVM